MHLALCRRRSWRKNNGSYAITMTELLSLQIPDNRCHFLKVVVNCLQLSHEIQTVIYAMNYTTDRRCGRNSA